MPEDKPNGQTPSESAPATPQQPAPEAASSQPPADGAAQPAPAPAEGTGPTLPEATALSDGTTPTVLKPGETPHKKLVTGKATLNSIYRRADILTTLFTAIGLIAAGGLILGAYLYFTRPANNTNNLPKPTKLEQAEIDKLKAFFEGNNAGTLAEVLNITSPSYFKNRAAFASDVRIIGATQITGPTALGDLTVDKSSTLGATAVRGQLTVTGPSNFTGPVILSAGASVTGNLTVGGNGTFAGSLSAGTFNATNLTVNGTLNLAGRIAIAGQEPSVSPGPDAGGTASVDGNDSGGTVIINTGTGVTPLIQQNGGIMVNITFKVPYPKVPHIVITPVGAPAARLLPYVQRTATGFSIGAAEGFKPATSYAFDYWISQ